MDLGWDLETERERVQVSELWMKYSYISFIFSVSFTKLLPKFMIQTQAQGI